MNPPNTTATAERQTPLAGRRQDPVAEPIAFSPLAPQLDIVVPVHNEQDALAHSVNRLYEYLSDGFPFSWRITIADNASTDDTPAVADALARLMTEVRTIHLDQKGRGRALRKAWSESDAQVVAYMDVDLSTDLAGLLPLVAPLVSGHSAVAIGTRLDGDSHVARGAKREFISRGYNRLLRAALRVRFSDAQCGFKALRADVARRLLPRVKDEEWFFDTELLVVAQRDGMRIHEVPVDWVDDPDSSVAITRTAWQDLRGTARLLITRKIVSFLAIGVCSTVAYALLYLAMRGPLGAQAANAAALAMTAIANTAANRRVTFGVRGRERLLRQHAMGFGVFVLTVLLTSVSLAALNAATPGASRFVELAVLIGASVAATLTRYVALNSWIFAHHRRDERYDRDVAAARAGEVTR